MKRETILKYFDYDKQKGQVMWKFHENPSVRTKLIGKEAGCVNKASPPYRYLELNGEAFPLHVLIFILEKNYRPFQIDHVNGNSLDNRIENLKACSNQNINQRNRQSHRNGRLPGCYFCKCTNRWRAQVRIDNKIKHLGRYDTEEQAYLVSKNYLISKGIL